MVTAILKIVEMMLLKYLIKGKKSFPKTMHLQMQELLCHMESLLSLRKSSYQQEVNIVSGKLTVMNLGT
jgi:hypothetical protein